VSTDTYYTRARLVALMKQKEGLHYTLGWLSMAYCMPAADEEHEMQLAHELIAKLEQMSDFVEP
jgi:Na+/H+ antiporter NhaA